MGLFIFNPILACSVCYNAIPATRYAYYFATALLILVPLVLLSALGVFIYQKMR